MIKSGTSMPHIYRLFLPQDWEGFRNRSIFNGHEHDLRDGFIHFSNAAQLRETAVKHYNGHTALILAEVDADGLGEALKWEVSRGGDLFPHLYAPLELAFVTRFWNLKATPQSGYDFPDNIV